MWTDVHDGYFGARSQHSITREEINVSTSRCGQTVDSTTVANRSFLSASNGVDARRLTCIMERRCDHCGTAP
jgi:hypothetical protein